MTTRIGSLRPDPEPPTKGNRQVDAENQREAWLRQMEMGQIALQQQTGTQNGQALTSNASRDNSAGAADVDKKSGGQQAHQIDNSSGAQNGGSTTFLPVHPILAPSQEASSVNRNENVSDSPIASMPTPTALTASTHLAAAAAHVEQSVSDDVQSSAVGAKIQQPPKPPTNTSQRAAARVATATAQPSPNASWGASSIQEAVAPQNPAGKEADATVGPTANASATNQSDSFANTATVASGTTSNQSSALPQIGQPSTLAKVIRNGSQAAAPATSRQLETAAGATSMPTIEVANPAPAQSTIAPLPPTQSPSNTALATPAAAAAGAQAAPPNAAETEAPVMDGETETDETEAAQPKKPAVNTEDAGEDWQKRMIHVAQNGQDVSVSIRDTSLLPNQSEQIVYRLAADMAQDGLHLRTATVNGKTLLKQAKTNSDERRSAQQDIKEQ